MVNEWGDMLGVPEVWEVSTKCAKGARVYEGDWETARLRDCESSGPSLQLHTADM